MLGYEALSRGPEGSPLHRPDALFAAAAQGGRLWDLELLCRTRALESAYRSGENFKLFLNVNPNIIHDDKFQSGFTREYLRSYGIDPHRVIFEITEKNAVCDLNGFKSAICNYKSQDYKIAIDDAGAGYSGLNLISDIQPHYIKLDMNLIRGIDRDDMKRALVKSMCEFSKITGTSLIAEGIETPEELGTLVDIGVQFGQGYYIGRPKEGLTAVSPAMLEVLHQHNARKNHLYGNRLSNIYLGNLSRHTVTVPTTETAADVYDLLFKKDLTGGVCVLEGDSIAGIVTKSELGRRMSGMYGYSLYSKKQIRDIMQREFLCLDYQTSVETAARLSMARPEETLYDFIVVTKGGKYDGTVTVRDLLERTIEIEVAYAKHQNPLTGLPGNLMIEQHLTRCVGGEGDYCVLYFDLDNFKAYNDVYGFESGDSVIRLVSEIIVKHVPPGEFVGHIGGDDFIAVLSSGDGEEVCKKVIGEFDRAVLTFYSEADIKSGYITARSRRGRQQRYPLLSLSVAGVAGRSHPFSDIYALSEYAAEIKKKCKETPGSCFSME